MTAWMCSVFFLRKFSSGFENLMKLLRTEFEESSSFCKFCKVLENVVRFLEINSYFRRVLGNFLNSDENLKSKKKTLWMWTRILTLTITRELHNITVHRDFTYFNTFPRSICDTGRVFSMASSISEIHMSCQKKAAECGFLE